MQSLQVNLERRSSAISPPHFRIFNLPLFFFEMACSLGKEGRARQARLAYADGKGSLHPSIGGGGSSAHRAAGGAPRAVDGEHAAIVEYLETVEKEERLRFHSTLVERMPVPMDCHGTMDVAVDPPTDVDPSHRSFRSCGLRAVFTFPAEGVVATLPAALAILRPTTSTITSLDLSRNELWLLPGLESLVSLEVLVG